MVAAIVAVVVVVVVVVAGVLRGMCSAVLTLQLQENDNV